MHTYERSRDPISGEGVVFHFNSDFSGEVIVEVKGARAVFHQVGDTRWIEVRIPAIDLVDFVLEGYVKAKAIEWIEQVDLRELLEKIK